MGRHRSTLRELGWGVSNSPNPWKQGSAKRVVRALDYSNVEVEPEAPAPEPASSAQAGERGAWEERLETLQQDGARHATPPRVCVDLTVASAQPRSRA